jgi:hypothetical protein
MNTDYFVVSKFRVFVMKIISPYLQFLNYKWIACSHEKQNRKRIKSAGAR